MPKKFWQFRNQAAGSAELLLYGDISDSSWWGDEVTPKTFADELNGRPRKRLGYRTPEELFDDFLDSVYAA